jgi:hypothetical protein
MFAPFAKRESGAAEPEASDKGTAPPVSGGIDELKRQMEEMQKRLDRLSDKDKG